MGILVQRQFSVAPDDRREFERQSRLGVWENMRHNGAQMIAYGSWAFGGQGDVVVTHSVYENFDHWTATRPWGEFASEPARVEETRHIRAICAGRARLVRESSARIIDYEDALSEPTPRYRNVGEPLAALPPTFGPQSIVEQSQYCVARSDQEAFSAVLRDVVWPWLIAEGSRVMIYGCDPLKGGTNIMIYTAYRDISHWHRLRGRRAVVPDDVSRVRDELSSAVSLQSRRLLMVITEFGSAMDE